MKILTSPIVTIAASDLMMIFGIAVKVNLKRLRLAELHQSNEEFLGSSNAQQLGHLNFSTLSSSPK